jgi:hypothetical protein
MATENPTWGYTRIRGGLKHLGHDLARNTIKSDPEGPRHRARTRTAHEDAVEDLPRAHWDRLAAADFFTVEVLTVAGLIRYVVLFVMKLKTRTVAIAGITSQPDETWMTEVARNLTNAEDGFLRGTQYFILDRDLSSAIISDAAAHAAASRPYS